MVYLFKQTAQSHYYAGTKILMKLMQLNDDQSTILARLSFIDVTDRLNRKSPSIPKILGNAISHLNKSLELDQNSADAFHNIAFSRYCLAEYNIGLNTDTDDVIELLNYALEAIDQAIKLNNTFPQAHNTKAMILAQLGDKDDAIKEIDIALAQDPSYKGALKNRERILQEYH